MSTQCVTYPQIVFRFNAMMDDYAKKQWVMVSRYPICDPALLVTTTLDSFFFTRSIAKIMFQMASHVLHHFPPLCLEIAVLPDDFFFTSLTYFLRRFEGCDILPLMQITFLSLPLSKYCFKVRHGRIFALISNSKLSQHKTI